ncbi:hypothetical protein [Cupriavidus sp. UYPR2.512]|uniref:hypothetical protein n=1 Tax=Cupriavidus sp. UYPR2.512 TaxID=1080187 RepID=UPI000360A083|nr:hypothetical protein [Cupriavidus sp. UYPR2.512]UIF85743.1 hypothetical protein KAF44_16970 [Cupriavidus necator]
MSNDFYASPQGAMAMHGAGRNLGRSEGWRDGYDEGIAEGVALGRRQAQEATQPQIEQLLSQVRALEDRTWTDREKYFAFAVVGLAAIESLGSASQEQQLAFLTAYNRLLSEAKAKQLLNIAPHASDAFERGNPVAAKFLRSMLAIAMQPQADHSPNL